MKKFFKEREKLHNCIRFWVGEWVALAAKPNNWNLVLGTQRLRGQNGPYKLASDFYVCYGTCVHKHTQREKEREPQPTPTNNKITK